MVDEGALKMDPQDEIVRGSLIVHEGRVVHEMITPLLEHKGE
jgi:hypothetical protein